MRSQSGARRYAPLAAIALLAALTIGGVALAGWKSSGEGGCGNFNDSLTPAQDGDVLTPMRSGVNANATVISKTLVVQGGWAPATGSCSDSGSNEFANAAAMIAAGFSYNPAQRTPIFSDFSTPVLGVELAGKTLVLQNLDISSTTLALSGIAVSGVISDGARLRLENIRFDNNQAGVGGSGGAIYLELRGGSQLVIADSLFSSNNAFSGGGLEVALYDGSTLLIENSSFENNNALSGNGGALRVVMHSGSVTLRGNSFSGNSATNGRGGAISLERDPAADGPTGATLADNSFSGNSAVQDADIYLDGVAQAAPYAYLPLIAKPGASSSFSVTISAVVMSEEYYRATFTASGYAPQLPGRHVHFFFNTVPPAQAGMPGSGPWKVYGSSAPFTQYGIKDRPKGATQLCALVANSDHTVIPGTGNCVDLP